MRKALTIFAAGATLMAGVASATGARAARAIVASPPSVVGACSAGTWVQTPANVTSAMVNGSLYADTIVSSTDAWAVGAYDSGPTRGSLWEHWTGGASWTVVSSGGVGVGLNAVTNFGPESVWAAGEIQKGSTSSYTAVISMWNGATIARATLPKKGKISSLEAISGSSASDIWASGEWTDSKGDQHILLYHYNGTKWSLAPVPSAAFNAEGILDLSPTSVYLVASAIPSEKVDVYHYNGAGWSVDLTNVPIDFDLGGFVGSSGSDFYGLAVPDYDGVDHWNGSTWSHVGTFDTNDDLEGLAEGPIGTVWSAGYFTGSNNDVYVSENGVRQTNPASVMTQTGIMSGITSGSGLVIAVGGQDEDGSIPHSEPIVVMSCN
jgi:hypothetical protein